MVFQKGTISLVCGVQQDENAIVQRPQDKTQQKLLLAGLAVWHRKLTQ